MARWAVHLLCLHHFKRFRHYQLAQEHHEHCNSLRKTLFIGLVMLFVIDPFHLQETTLAISGEVSDRLDAMLYTAPSAGKIAVVLIDEPAIAQDQQNWPPSFPFWNDLLGMTLQHRPAAIYFDFSFDYPRPSFTTPQDEAWQPASDAARAQDEASLLAAQMTGALGEPPVPVILGSEGRLAVLRSRLSGCANPARNGEWTSVLPILACAATESDFFDFPLPDDHRGYPLWTGWSAGQRNAISRTPAAALAALSCSSLQPAPRWCAAAGVNWLALPVLQRGPAGAAIIPRWSLYSNSIANPPEAINETGCTRYRDAGGFSRSLNWLALFAEENLAGPMQNLLPNAFLPIESRTGTPAEPCLPFPVITASALLDHSGTYSRPLDTLLQNRIVLIGDGRRYSPDHVPVPLQQNLPGVILQATTLETLLTAGPGYPQISDPLRRRQNRMEVAMRLAILIFAIVLDILARHFRAWWQNRGKLARLAARPAAPRRSAAVLRKISPDRVFGWPVIVTAAISELSFALLINATHWLFLRWVFLLLGLLLLALVLLRLACRQPFTLLFAGIGIALVLALRTSPWAPANWVFLIAEIIAVALSLGEVRPPGAAAETQEPEASPGFSGKALGAEKIQII